MPATVKIKARIVRSFDDAGTGKSYAAGSICMIERGRFDNYLAAALVAEAPAGPTRKTSARNPG